MELTAGLNGLLHPSWGTAILEPIAGAPLIAIFDEWDSSG